MPVRTATRIYGTHTAPPLAIVIIRDGTDYRVAIVGDREKVLYEGDNQLEAQRVYKHWMDHYEQRKQEEQQGA